jgi:L-ribulose-5-phosphate 4-epimerase
MLKELKERVYAANQDLVAKGVVLYTWGNVSEVDRENGVVVIKPSGVDYSVMKPDDMVVVELSTGKTVEGKWKPSSDTPTHLELYRAFSQINGVTHTHSTNAVVFAQAGLAIPALGTTHADYFYGDIPCTRALSQDEVEVGYETNTGKVIVEKVRQSGYEVLDIPGILVKNHGPFTWGINASDSVYKAVVMEAVADMALKTLLLNSNSHMPQYILDKHYFRKHGPKAYYGQ